MGATQRTVRAAATGLTRLPLRTKDRDNRSWLHRWRWGWGAVVISVIHRHCGERMRLKGDLWKRQLCVSGESVGTSTEAQEEEEAANQSRRITRGQAFIFPFNHIYIYYCADVISAWHDLHLLLQDQHIGVTQNCEFFR